MPRHDRPEARTEKADSRKAVEVSRELIQDSWKAMDSSGPVVPHPPVILEFGPREYAVLARDRAEAGAPVYRIVQRGIKAASSAGVIARKLLRGAK